MTTIGSQRHSARALEAHAERGRCCFAVEATAPSVMWSLLVPELKTAILHRMVLTDHVCPFGVRAKQMLEQAGYAVDDHILSSRAEVDAFEAEQGVDTTPQVFIGGERIGGADDLERYLAT